MKIIYQLLSIVVIGALLSGCAKKEKQESVEKSESKNKIVTLKAASIKDIGLERVQVALQSISGTMSIPAKVVANQDNEAVIGSLVQGRVHKVYANVGDYVKAGQVLMTVEGLDVGQIKSSFLKSKAAFEYAKANYERQKKLFDEKIGAQKSLLETQAEFEKASAEFKAEDKKIHALGLSDVDIISAKNDEQHTSGTLPIKASINGVVVERNVVIGQSVDVSTNAFRVMNTASLWVDGQIYEKDIAKPLRKARVEFTAASFKNEKFKGALTYIGQVVDEHSRTITVRGTFANPGNQLKPNMFGELHIPLAENTKGLLVPEESIVNQSGEHFVFVAINDTSFEMRKVKLGGKYEQGIEIIEGIKEGENIVSKGTFYLLSEVKKDEIEGD